MVSYSEVDSLDVALQRRPGLGGVAAAAATELAATADDDGGRGGSVAVVS